MCMVLIFPFFVFVCIAAASHYVLTHRRVSIYSFPSPPADFVLGHARFVPMQSPWKKFSEWKKDFGDVILLSVVGKPVIVLNSAESAKDLLQGKGGIYSDRPISTLLQMIGWADLYAFNNYGERFKARMRIIQRYMGPHSSSLCISEAKNIRSLLRNILDSPNDFWHHVDWAIASTIINIAYGRSLSEDDKEYIDLTKEAINRALAAGIPGLNPLDFFPFIRFLTSWLPGMSFIEEANITRELKNKMLDIPFDRVKKERECGSANPSLVNNALEDLEREQLLHSAEKEGDIKFCAGTLYAETSTITVLTFILLMVQHPEVVKAAQAELDRVVPFGRLPSLDDRPKLRYIDCILKEVLRINPPAPLAAPHRVREEDVYRNKVIPNGSLVITNIWEMMHDERYFSSPETFSPDRFASMVRSKEHDVTTALNSLDPNDPSTLAFGIGRRICPGRFFVDAFLWLTMANFLAVFDFLPPVDPITGEEEVPPFEFSAGMTSIPKVYACRIIPRSDSHEKLIRQECYP